VVKSEEERFSATLSQGLHLLEDVIHRVRESGADTIPGEELFRLYDTYGFPFDVAQEIAAEQGLAVDEEGFQKELERQRERARASWKGGDLQVAAVYRRLADQGIRSEFVGYTELTDVPARVVALIAGEELVDRLAAGETGEVVLDRTPFYAEAGGQVGDRGVIETAGARAEVIDTLSPVSGVRVHRVQVKQGEFRVGAEVVASVDIGRRLATMSNHTATHLLHAALREVLGEHVKQAGSLVAPERLRFDFTHFRPLTREEIRRIEERVNEQIRKNLQVSTEIKTLDEALSSGATALFGEKYDERVRVVSVPGFSCELCGGTHVGRTGDISLFKIVSEGSVASGIRRIEAVTGAAALQRFLEDEEAVQAVADRLRVGRERVVEAVERLQEEVRQAERELERLRRQLAERESRKAVEHARTVQGVKVVTCRTDVTDRVTMRRMAADMLQRLKSGVVVLGGSENGKVNLVAMVSPDLTAKLRADQLIRPVAEKVGGGGGGKPELAEAGGKNPERLEEALEFVYEVVDQVLEGSRQPT
jgi:alanyl-tRNA synthetase